MRQTDLPFGDLVSHSTKSRVQFGRLVSHDALMGSIRGRRGKGTPLRHPDETFVQAFRPNEFWRGYPSLWRCSMPSLGKDHWCHDEYEGMKIPSAPAALIMSNLDQGGLFFERCGGGFAASSLLRFVAFWVRAAGAASPPPRFLESLPSFLSRCGGGFASSSLS